MSVGAETGHAHAGAHVHHVGPQHKRRLRDVVLGDAGLRGQRNHFGLLLRADHHVLALIQVLGGGG